MAEPKKDKRKKKAAPNNPGRRNFKQEQEFKTMEASILEAEESVERLEAILCDHEAVKSLGKEVAVKTRELEEAKNRVEGLYARWEELSELQPYG